MSKLPVVSGDVARAAFERAGWTFQRQSGSHMILTKEGHIVTLSIPRHRQLAPGTIRRLIRDAGMSVDEFHAFIK
jgi:predicted RNA binding protein YcfA (HicA-like mRNA interferase family)